MTRRLSIPLRTNSVKARIVLLAVLTCLLMGAAASGFIYLLRNTESAQIGSSERRLAILAQTLGQDYAAQSRYEAQAHRPLALSSPREPGSEQVLSLMTSVVLQHEIGVEGGFYSTADDDLLGYAFPTHEGPGRKKDIPEKERPAITELARKAATTGQPQSLRFSGARDAIVFVASPVKIDGSIPGSTWLMQRLPGVNSGRNLQLLFGSIGFALAAFVCALVAFLITAQVQAGVSAVLARLGSLQQDFSGARTAQPQLAEFEQVLAEVDALSRTLKQKIESERQLENRLRHQERLSALGQFAAGIAHELRNPLATIRLRTQMSERASGTESLTKNTRVVLEEIDRLDTMIERLLYFSRPIRLALEPVDLAILCTDVL
ncbi:MAG: histidine kinase dimerization/phospho-acceptor domain-containing protein, partial [Acidobacteriaceae bacterium]